jgi:hypothetical protein
MQETPRFAADVLRPWVDRQSLHDALHDRRGVTAEEREPPNQQRVQHNTQRPHVGGAAVVVFTTENLHQWERRRGEHTRKHTRTHKDKS